MPQASPFRAGFGKVPPVLAGRDEIVTGFRNAIEVGSWSQERVTLIRGFRGVGKTVVLETLRRVAEDSGWVTIDETASPGFSTRMMAKLRIEIDRLDPAEGTRLSAVTIAPVGGLEFEHVDGPTIEPTFESLVEALASLVEPHGGILFTVDEVNETSMDEFRTFAGAVQRSVSRDREIAFVVAGLHNEIAAVLHDKPSTFLRRADQQNLDLLDWDSTLKAIRVPIEEHGRSIGDSAVDYAARASQGYPFLTQLIGDLAWKEHPDAVEVTLEDVQAAARKSRRRMGQSIHEPALSPLSATERTVLAAMAQDDGRSAVADLRSRLGMNSKQHFNNLRTRLLDSGLVYTPARGYLDFSLPYMRDYLREHTVTDAMGATSADIAKARASFPPPPDDL